MSHLLQGKNLWTETLTEEILTVDLMETVFDYPEEPNQYSVSTNLAHQISVTENLMHCLRSKYLFKIEKKVSVDSLMDKMQPVILENKRFDSQEILESSAISG